MELWLAPDLNADLVPLVTQPDLWATARARIVADGGHIQIFGQSTYADTAEQIAEWQVGPNAYQSLKYVDWFRRIADLGLPLAVELGGIKSDGKGGLQDCVAMLHLIFDRVEAAGGRVGTFSLDDPLAAAQHELKNADGTPRILSVPDAADLAASVLEAGAARGAHGGITEAFPLGRAADIVEFVQRVSNRILLAHLHLDIDYHAFPKAAWWQPWKQPQYDAAIGRDLRWMRDACGALHGGRCTFGVLANGVPDSPQAYHDATLANLRRLRDLLGDWPERVVLESFEKRNLPANVPESNPLSHAALVNEIWEMTRS